MDAQAQRCGLADPWPGPGEPIDDEDPSPGNTWGRTETVGFWRAASLPRLLASREPLRPGPAGSRSQSSPSTRQGDNLLAPLPITRTVVVLHGHNHYNHAVPGPAPRQTARHRCSKHDVADLPGPDQPIQRGESLLWIGVVLPSGGWPGRRRSLARPMEPVDSLRRICTRTIALVGYRHGRDSGRDGRPSSYSR